MLQKWHNHGAVTYAGYILGFPADTKSSILRDIEMIKRELPIDILEFFFLTPLPASEDHKVLSAKGIWMDADMNKYDLTHRCPCRKLKRGNICDEVHRVRDGPKCSLGPEPRVKAAHL